MPTDPTVPIRAPHRVFVRGTHWFGTVAFLLLLFTGVVILMAHPRLYWGETGNNLTPAWLELPISRNHQHGGWVQNTTFGERPGAPTTAIRTYSIFNENGWGRSLHFLSAWMLVAAGVVYLAGGVFSGHFRSHLLPRQPELSGSSLWTDIIAHARLQIPAATGGPQYGLLQKLAYSAVVFVVLPGMVLTGCAMSPAVTASQPWLLTLCGGYQSARSVHFLLTLALVLFLVVHVVMIVKSGFRRQMRAMTIGGSHEAQ